MLSEHEQGRGRFVMAKTNHVSLLPAPPQDPKAMARQNLLLRMVGIERQVRAKDQGLGTTQT